MRIELAIKHLKILKKLYPEIDGTITKWQEVAKEDLQGSVSNMNYKKFISIIKESIYTMYVQENIELKHKDLILNHFQDKWGGVNVFKLDAWLHNKLLHLGYKIHDMNGLEKLNYYTDNNKKFSWLVKPTYTLKDFPEIK